MTLRIVNDTHEIQVGNDLAHIIGPADNGHLGTNPGAPNTTDTVTYAQAVHDTVNDRMNALINGFASNPIVIQGVDSTFVLPDGNVVNQVAGETITNPSDHNAAGTGLNANAVVNVVYDVNACSGSGYFVFDTGGHPIPFPTEVILYHELAHAFHWVNNDFNAGAPEPQAETDENDMRAKEGLTARDVNNHAGGCGSGPPTKNCFIVSAAYGSPYAPEVRAFQRVRDELVRAAPVGDRFFTRLMEDYYAFSRPLAARIEARPSLRAPVAAFVVAPLLAHLTALQSCARLAWGAECDGVAARVLEASLAAVRAGGASSSDVAGGAAALREIVASPDFAGHASTAEDPRSPAGVFGLLAAGITGRLHRDSPAAWGLVHALRDAWTALESLDGGADPLACGVAAVDALRTWLSSAPLLPVLRTCSTRDGVEGMRALATSTYTCQEMRVGVADAIVAGAAPHERDRIAAMLGAAGYAPRDTARGGA